MYLATNLFGFISVARKIKKTPTLHQPNEDKDGSRSQEGFITENFTFYPPSEWIWTYIPRYLKFFNSFEVDPLPNASRFRYVFINEPYLYKLTHYKFYKKDQINDFILSLKKKQKEDKFSFDIPDMYLYKYFSLMLLDELPMSR